MARSPPRIFGPLLSLEARPLILQSDLTIVLETAHPAFEAMRASKEPLAVR